MCSCIKVFINVCCVIYGMHKSAKRPDGGVPTLAPRIAITHHEAGAALANKSLRERLREKIESGGRGKLEDGDIEVLCGKAIERRADKKVEEIPETELNGLLDKMLKRTSYETNDPPVMFSICILALASSRPFEYLEFALKAEGRDRGLLYF